MSRKHNIKFESLKEIKKELKEINLLDASFLKIHFQQITHFVGIILLQTNSQTWHKGLQNCFQIFQQHSNSSSIELQLKQLCFIHLVSQSIKRNWEQQQQINKAIEFLTERLQHLFHKSTSSKPQQIQSTANQTTHEDTRERASSIAINWIKNKFSVSKEKKVIESKIEQKGNKIAHSNSVNSKIAGNREGRINALITSKEKTIEREQSPFPTRKHLDKEISSLDMLMKKKLYEPYLVFLLKFFMAKTIFYKSNTDANQTEKIWLIINVFLKMIEVTQSFNQFIRYSSVKYEPMVVFLIQVFQSDIKNLYSSLAVLIKRKKGLIDQHIEAITKNQGKLLQSEKGLTQIQQKFIKQLKLREFKEIIEQISVVNQGLCFLYLNKYIYSTLSSIGIRPPITITTAGSDFDFIFQLLSKQEKKQQKNHRQSKVSSNSIQKLPLKTPAQQANKTRNSAIMMKDRLKKQKKRTDAQPAIRRPESRNENKKSEINNTEQRGRVSQFERAINIRRK